MLRRELLASLAALAASPALAGSGAEPGLQLGQGAPFDPTDVIDRARALSRTAYQPPARVPEAWTALSYDDYQSIWFDTRNALWAHEMQTPLRLDVFSPGLYFPNPVDIAVIENGTARPVLCEFDVFDKTDKFPALPTDDTLGYSGLRLRSELAQPGIYQEFAVFQGASYFRAIGTGNIYGLSARGLTIDTAEPEGEEFPEFRAFWLEKPSPGEDTFTLHALLDSPSATGAYRFEITPGSPLVIEVTATVFARRDIDNVGIAPLTSMFQYDQTNRHRFSDFRPAVHDSDGLLIVNGAGETIWRPLANPNTLQISAFVDDNPQGFGLMQRAPLQRFRRSRGALSSPPRGLGRAQGRLGSGRGRARGDPHALGDLRQYRLLLAPRGRAAPWLREHLRLPPDLVRRGRLRQRPDRTEHDDRLGFREPRHHRADRFRAG